MESVFLCQENGCARVRVCVCLCVYVARSLVGQQRPCPEYQLWIGLDRILVSCTIKKNKKKIVKFYSEDKTH